MKLNFGIKFIPLCSEVDSKELSREDLGPPMDTPLASLRTGETGLLFSHASLDLAHHRRAASQPRACGLPSPSHRGLPTLATQGEQPGAPCLILSRSSAQLITIFTECYLEKVLDQHHLIELSTMMENSYIWAAQCGGHWSLVAI